jgi:hypothetical protein
MNPLITPVVVLQDTITKSDYEYLLEIEYNGVKPVIVGTVEQIEQLKQQFDASLQTIKPLFVDTETSTLKLDFFKQITTPYWTIFSPHELVAPNFIEHVTNSLTNSHSSNAELIYLLGFLSGKDTSVSYSQSSIPNLSKTLKLHQLFNTLYWQHPLIKIVFNTEVCNEFTVTPLANTSFFVSYQLTCIEYLAAIYTLSNFTEPVIEYFPAPFLIPSLTEPSKEELTQLRSRILSKESLWKKNVWSKVYWQSLYFSKKYQHLL